MADLFTLVGTIAINYEDAHATIDDTMDKVNALKGEITGVGTQADKAGAKIGKDSTFGAAAVFLGNMATKAAAAMWRLSKTIFNTGVDYNANMEVQIAGLKTLMNVSIEEAELFYAKLEDFAKETPLSPSGVVENAQQLLMAGIMPDDIIPTLQMLGDISMGREDLLSRIVRAYTQTENFGKLRAQEVYQMLDANVPLYDMLKDYFGIDSQELAEMQKDGLIVWAEMHDAMKAYTEEGGRYYGAMQEKMKTYDGQMEKMGDTAKQAAGSVTKPFFEIFRDDIIGKLTTSLETFKTWADENQEGIKVFAQSLGDIAVLTFDGLLGLFEYVTENKDAIPAAFTVIGAAVTSALAKSHPYMAALAAVITGYQTLVNASEKLAATTYKEYYFDGNNQGFTEEYHLMALQRYIEAMRECEELQSQIDDGRTDLLHQFNDVKDVIEVLDPIVNGPNNLFKGERNLMTSYDSWRNFIGKPGEWVDVMEPGSADDWYKAQVKIADESESEMQKQLDDMGLEVDVQVNPDFSNWSFGFPGGASNALITLFDPVGPLNRYGVDGTHASGLDYVPYDNYIARLHRGETILNAQAAAAWRSGETGQASRMEAALGRVEGLLQQIISNTGAGQTVVLDSGVLVGQIAPMMDAQLGVLGGRRGRRN